MLIMMINYIPEGWLNRQPDDDSSDVGVPWTARYGPVGFDLFQHLFTRTTRCRSAATRRPEGTFQWCHRGF